MHVDPTCYQQIFKQRTKALLLIFSAVLHDKYILVFGGSAFPFGATSSNDLYVLQIRSGQRSTGIWRQLDTVEESKPPKQYGHAMLLHENKLYVIGGTSGFHFNMKVYELALNDIINFSGQLRWKSLLRGPECMPR
jgi:hypothetical protein